MRRRILYAVMSIMTVNLVLMGAMFVHMRNEDRCDVTARGLVVWDDDRDAWIHLQSPREPTDLAPCKGRLETELKVLPG